MEIKEVQMTATLWVEMTREDLDIIWACAERHYDLKVEQMTKQGGLLYGIKNHFTWPDVKDEKVNIRLSFRDLDTMAKALELSKTSFTAWQAGHLDIIGKKEWIAKGGYLLSKIDKMLRFINAQSSLKAVEHKVEYEVTK